MGKRALTHLEAAFEARRRPRFLSSGAGVCRILVGCVALTDVAESAHLAAGGWSTAHTGKPNRQPVGPSGGPSCGGRGWALTSSDVVPHLLRVRPVVYRRREVTRVLAVSFKCSTRFCSPARVETRYTRREN